MNEYSWIRSLRRPLRAFPGAQDGNVAVIFALTLIPVFGLVGAAVDYSRGNSTKAALQAALDATALILSREAPSLSDQEITQKANNYFKAQFTRPEAENTQVAVTYTRADSTLVLSASTSVPTTIARVIGQTEMKIGSATTIKWGMSQLRVALALDATGSMASAGKIDALKTATKNLLTTLKGAAVNAGDVYVSIIPFSKDVNLTSSNYNASWLDWSEWEAPPANATPNPTVGPGSSCPFSNSAEGFRCTSGPVSGSGNASSIPSSGTYKGYICPSVDNGTQNVSRRGSYYNGCWNSIEKPSSDWQKLCEGNSCGCGSAANCSCSGNGANKVCIQKTYSHEWIKNARSTWNGCVRDRGTNTPPGTSAGYDQRADAPQAGIQATLFQAEQYANCSPEASGLSYNWSMLTTLVDSLYPAGSTNQPIGLVWAWQSLVGGGPFTAPAKDPSYAYNDIIILMSDGLNTQDRWYGNGSGSSNDVDGRMYAAGGAGTCKNIKDTGVTIYTVQVNTDGDPISALLKNCASGEDKFFHLTSAGELVTTFNQIGTKLAKLRIAK